MFSPPPKVLQRSLHKLLDYARDYVADVRFDYPSAQIWAHRGTSDLLAISRCTILT